MPANHNVPHTDKAKAKMSEARRGVPLYGKRRKPVFVDGVAHFLCRTCEFLLPISDFYSNKRSPIGIKSECKRCHCATTIRTRDTDAARMFNRATAMNARAKEFGVSGHITKAELLLVLDAFALSCAACGSKDSIEIDHVVPLSLGGINRPVNLQCLCSDCNDHKHAKAEDFRTQAHLDAVWAISFKRI